MRNICRSGRIYIGAKTSESEVLGTLAHELTHYAMKILFDNGCKPFDGTDITSKKEFESIVEEYKNIEDHIPIVEGIFQWYPETSHIAELIVRVPHIIAHYHQHEDQKILLSKKYESLFNFYKKNILAKIESFTKDPEKFHIMREAQQTNERLGNVKGIELCCTSNILIDESTLNSQRTQILISDIPQLAKAIFTQSLQKTKTLSDIKRSHIFASVKDFENEFYIQTFHSLICGRNRFKPTFVVTIEAEDKIEQQEKLLKFLEENADKAKFVLIKDKENNCIESCLPKQQIDVIYLNHKWEDLAEKLQDRMLEQEIIFQDVPMKLSKLLGKESKALNELSVIKLFNKSQIYIDSPIKLNKGYDPSFYIERRIYE